MKRDIEVIALNPDAEMPSDEGELGQLFEANYESVEYPLYGIGTLFYFENKPTPAVSELE